jgi:hypothetical protein
VRKSCDRACARSSGSNLYTRAADANPPDGHTCTTNGHTYANSANTDTHACTTNGHTYANSANTDTCM